MPPPSASASSCFFIDLGETIARRATRRERSARRSLAVLFRASSTSGPSVSPSSEGERRSTKSSSGRLAFAAQRRRRSPPPRVAASASAPARSSGGAAAAGIVAASVAATISRATATLRIRG